MATSIVVAAELRFGVMKKGSDRLARQIDVILTALDVLPWDAPFDESYAQIRTNLEAGGQLIGANDMLIAAHAAGLDAVLVTDNTREFARVSGLRYENWLSDDA